MPPKAEDSLKLESFWLNAIVLAILAIALPFLFTPQEFFPDHRLLPYVLNASHIPFFFLLTWIGINVFGPLRSNRFFTLLVIVNLVVLLIGFGVESIQTLQGRLGNTGDLIRNAIGASLASTIHPRAPQPPRAFKLSLVLALSVLVLIALFPLFRNAVDWIHARNQFPVLADFETPFQRDRWLGGEIVRLDDSVNRAIGFRFDSAKYSTLSLVNFERDWSGYDCFRFRIFNPKEDIVRLNLRINDLDHDLSDQRYDDRFNLSIDADPGWNSYHVDLASVRKAPRKRSMNLREIKRVLFFTSSLIVPVTLYFDDLILDADHLACSSGDMSAP